MNLLANLITQIVNKDTNEIKSEIDLRKEKRKQKDREWHAMRAKTLTEEQKQVLRDRRKESYKRYQAKQNMRKAGNII